LFAIQELFWHGELILTGRGTADVPCFPVPVPRKLRGSGTGNGERVSLSIRCGHSRRLQWHPAVPCG
jgi:hypothetical protein